MSPRSKAVEVTARITLAGTIVALLLACGGSTPAPSAKDPIKIGGMWDLTGAVATVITTIYHATQLAIADTNSHGGINGHQIVMTDLDDASDPATGTANYRRLVDRDGVRLIIGPDYTPVAVAVANLAGKDKVLIYTSGSTATALTTPLRPYVFAAPPTADASGKAIAGMIRSMGSKKVGVIEQSDAYGQQNTAALTASLQAHGAGIASKTEIAATAIDATSQVVKMKQAGVDVVVIGVSENPAVAIVKGAYQQQLNVPILSFQAGYQPSIEQLLTSSTPIEYYAATPLSCPLGVGDCAQDFAKQYQSRYSEKVTPFAIMGYAGAQAFIAALKRASKYDPESVIAALESSPEYKSTLVPPIKYSSTDHRGVTTQFMVGYKDGRVYFFGNDIKSNKLKG